MKKILIISNRVLSNTDNNGKTLYSLIKSYPKESVSQLYFYCNLPVIPGYNYFQLSDVDVVVGRFCARGRGRKVEAAEWKNDSSDCLYSNFTIESKYKVKRSDGILLLREFIWKNAWRSKQLEEWLEQVRPEIVLFMAGDSMYAYRVCAYVVNKFHSRLFTYVTDDYVLPRSSESIFARYRRKKVTDLMRKCVKRSQRFYTISESMRIEYKRLFGKDSVILYNRTESLRDDTLCGKSEKNKKIAFVYAGSLYYGRGSVLLNLAEAIKRYNDRHINEKKAELWIYTNLKPDVGYLKKLHDMGTAVYGGALDKEELKEKLNLSNILVFVESFEKEQMEKTRLSFSTKIPEYLSLGKPIFAIGPQGIGSMDFLKNTAVCVNRRNDIYNKLENLLTKKELQNKYADAAQISFQNMEQNKADTLKL